MDAAPDCRSVVPGLQARPASLLLDSKAASSPGSASSPKPSSTTQSCTRRRPVVFSATSRVPTASSTAVALRAASQRFLDLIDDLDALLWCRYRADPRVATGVPSSRSSQLASRRPVEWPVPDGPALARHLGLHRPRSSAWGCSSSRWRTAPAARVPIVVMPAQRRGFSQADPGQEEKTDEHAPIVGEGRLPRLMLCRSLSLGQGTSSGSREVRGGGHRPPCARRSSPQDDCRDGGVVRPIGPWLENGTWQS